MNEEVFIQFTKGYDYGDKVLKLINSVYGITQDPLNCFNNIYQGLHNWGLESSMFDTCLLILDGVIFLFYVDDWLMYARNKEDTDSIISKMK